MPTQTSPEHPPRPLLTVGKLLPQGRGLSAVLVRRAATVELDWDVRQKSRFDATDSQGRALGVFLPRGSVVRGGDVLVAEDGSLVKVLAKPQPVMVVRACAEHGSPFDLVRAAYHLGNRHVPLQLEPDRLKLEPDHVLAALMRRMHLIVTDAVESFEPEGGAYAEAGTHGHGQRDLGTAQGHEHGHEHGHPHAHEHAHVDQHEHAIEHEHEHGHEHAHERGHGHAHTHGHDHAHGHDHPDGQGHRHGHDHGEGPGRDEGRSR